MFSSAKKRERSFIHSLDPSGKSVVNRILIRSNSGRIELSCTEWEENFRIKNNYEDGLDVNLI